MKIFKDTETSIEVTNKFVINKSKNVIYFSTILKILSFVIFIFKSICPKYFIASSIFLFINSLYLDYKILSNINHLIFLKVQKNIEDNPYESGYYLGKICITIFKKGFIDRIKGFYNGIKTELFS